MTQTTHSSFSPQWLELREEADATARAAELIGPLRAFLDRRDPLVIRDLGCGTGSMGRWLAGRLPGPQHWILHDHDPRLLDLAVTRLPAAARDAAVVTAAPERRDVTRLQAADLAGTSLVTASALLDLLTGDEVIQLAMACVRAGCPALLALSVIGRVEFTPADPLDAQIQDAFNAHQRRSDLLGPDGVAVTAMAFERLGATVHRHPSPWRLGPAQADLTAEWLRGWVGAAVEHQPGLADAAGAYLDRRLATCAAGDLRVTVGHEDVLALPGRQVRP